MESWDILLGVHEAMLGQSLRDGSDRLTAWKTQTMLARRDRERRLRILDSRTMYQNNQSIVVGPEGALRRRMRSPRKLFGSGIWLEFVLRSGGGDSRFFQVA